MTIPSRRGSSMVEIVVAIGVLALAIGPMLTLLSYSSKSTNYSVYEELAVQYAREIADQLLRLTPKFPSIINIAGPSANLSSLLSDSKFTYELNNKTHTEPRLVNLTYKVKKLGTRIFLSPLKKMFDRKIIISAVNTSFLTSIKANKLWKVVINISWKDKNSTTQITKHVKMGILINEL